MEQLADTIDSVFAQKRGEAEAKQASNQGANKGNSFFAGFSLLSGGASTQQVQAKTVDSVRKGYTRSSNEVFAEQKRQN